MQGSATRSVLYYKNINVCPGVKNVNASWRAISGEEGVTVDSRLSNDSLAIIQPESSPVLPQTPYSVAPTAHDPSPIIPANAPALPAPALPAPAQLPDAPLVAPVPQLPAPSPAPAPSSKLDQSDTLQLLSDLSEFNYHLPGRAARKLPKGDSGDAICISDV